MDRTVIVDLVEDYRRSIIPAMQTGGLAAYNDVNARFEERVKQTAVLLAPVEAASFSQIVEAERERLMAEYQADPTAVKNRLGFSLGRDDPRRNRRPNPQGLGEMAVRTALRATIWKSIWAVFRNAR